MLEVVDLAVTYGGVKALNGLNLTVRAGSVCGLIGPNGAGKTTAMDAITGFTRPSRGDVFLGGVSIKPWAPHRRVRAGLSRTFQTLEIFDDLTVRQNVAVALRGLASQTDDRVDAALDLAGATDFADSAADGLSYGKRRLISFARAVAAQPEVLLLDEPAAGLDSDESMELAHRIRGLAEQHSTAILLIDHDMRLVLDVCDHIEVIDFGVPIASGTPSEIAADAAVIRAYVGEE